MQPLKLLRHPTTWGAAGVALATIVALVATWLYLSPPAQKTVTFYTDDSASIHPGDQVRIAGVPAGKVKDLALEWESNQVRVRAQVDNDVFVGSQSQVEVRMLTPVGGYYVNLIPLGDTPLGAKSIPLERVRMPYSLVQTLADATRITDKLEAKPIKESLDQLQQGFVGTNVESLAAIIDAGNSLMSTIEKQRGQVTAILNFSDEYIHSLSNFSDGLRELVRKSSIVEQTFALYNKKFGDGILAFSTAIDQLSSLGYFYIKHRDKMLVTIREWLEKARMWARGNGVLIRGIREVRNKIERVLDAQNAPPELLATNMCLPVPGNPC